MISRRNNACQAYLPCISTSSSRDFDLDHRNSVRRRGFCFWQRGVFVLDMKRVPDAFRSRTVCTFTLARIFLTLRTWPPGHFGFCESNSTTWLCLLTSTSFGYLDRLLLDTQCCILSRILTVYSLDRCQFRYMFGSF